MLKKLVSLCAAISIAFSVCQGALAAQVITGEKTWTQTFDGISENTAPEEMRMTEITEEAMPGITTGGVTGKYGKAYDDTAFSIKASADENGVYSTNQVTLKNDAGDDNKTAIMSGINNLSADSIVHISFEYAIDSYNAERSLHFIGRRDTKSSPLEIKTPMFELGSAGEVSVFGSSTDYTMPLDKWVKYDYIITDPKGAEGSNFYVYADGKKILEKNMQYPYKASSSKLYCIYIYGVATIEFNVTAGELAVNETVGTYLDNYSISIVTEYPELNDIILSHSDPSISGNIDNIGRTMTLPSSVTAEEIVNGLNVENSSVVDTEGNPQTGNIRSGYVKVPCGNDTIYYALNVYEQDFFYKEDFNGKTIDNPYSLLEQTALQADANILTASEIAGRDSQDTSLVLNTEAQSSLNWTAKQGIEEGRVTFETAVLMKNGTADVGMDFNGNKKTIASFAENNNIYINGVAEKLTWKPNQWYKIVASIDTLSATWSIYINGKIIIENVPIDEELFTSGTGAITGININMNENTGLAIDDLYIHSGEYVPGADLIEIESLSDDYIIIGDIIYIPYTVTNDILSENISLGQNTVMGAIYTSSDMSVKKDNNELADGNVLVFHNMTLSTYENYSIKVINSTLGISGVGSRFLFDNEARTVFAPAFTSASDFYEKITLYPGHTGTLIDKEGNAISETDTIRFGKDDGIVYRVQYTNAAGTYSNDYEINTMYNNESFDELYGDNIPAGSVYNGFLYNRQGISGGTITATGVKDPAGSDNNVVQLYSKPGTVTGDAKITFRLSELEQDKTKSPYVISYDIYVSDTKASNDIILKYTNYDGVTGNYYTILSFNSSGGVVFAGETIGSYRENEWNNIILLVNPSGTSASQVYLNGERVFNKNVGRFQKTIASVEDFIFTHGITSSERSTYLDNIKFYPISSVSAFDASDMDCSISSQWDIIDDNNTITGYGPATADQFMGLFTFPAAASVGLYYEDGKTPVTGDTLVSEGMKLIIVSGNGKYSSEYITGKALRIDEPTIKIGGRDMNYLIAGEVTGEASVYSAIPQAMTLTLTYTDGINTNTVTAQRTETDTGSTLLVTDSAGTVKNTEGEKITLTLTDTKTGQLLAEEKSIEWTGQLDLSSEIMPAKNGATSIVTVTIDDGLTNTLNKCNTWFEQYGIKGTSVIWSDRAAGSQSTYENIYSKGFIDVASHSKTHKDLTNYSGLTDELRIAEMQGSRDELRNMFPGQEVLTFAPSNNRMDEVSDNMVSNYYWAVRRGQRGYNTLNPPESSSAGGWYNLKIQGSYNPQDMNNEACTLNDCLDIAAENPVWLIYMYHSIESKEGVGTLPVLDGVASSNFKKMGEMQDAGDIWVATMNEATKYIRERQHSTVEDVATETSRTVKIIPDGELPSETFNYPLTVRSQIPEDWAKDGVYIKVTQGGKVQAPKAVNADGGLYVYYDAVPSDVPVILECVDTPPVVTIDSLEITSEGELSQETGATSEVKFTASTVPQDNTDLSGIEWYVNDVKQDIQPGTLSFAYHNEKKGVYNIYAKDSLTGIVSNTVTITVTEAGLLFEDDFEGYGNTDTLPSSKWYANTEIGLKEFYPESGNHAAQVFYNENAKYPGLHKTVSLNVGEPTVYSGTVALVGNSQSFFLDLRNSETNATATAKTLIKIKGGAVYPLSSGDAIAYIDEGKWLNYSLCITPAVAGEMTKLRITLSSPYLSDVNHQNTGVPVVYETTINLDDTAIAENGSANMVHNNDFSKANSSCFNYLDNVRIYNPQSTALEAPEEAIQAGNPVTVTINKDVYNFSTDMVTVKNSDGSDVDCEVEFDSSHPRIFTLRFNEGTINKNSTYSIILDGRDTLIDAVGNNVGAAEIAFTTSSLDPIEKLSITANGALEQTADNMTPVVFSAVSEPSENIDVSSVKWYVNDVEQDTSGLTFTYTPSAKGVYEIYAKSSEVTSESIVINVSTALASALEINSSGKLTQYEGNYSAVELSAAAVPEDSVFDENMVKWYVNNEEVYSGSAKYTFTPSQKGKYEIYAKIGDKEQSASNIITCKVITPTVQQYEIYDDFESYGTEGTRINNDNCGDWSYILADDVRWVEAAKDPEDLNNMTAMFIYDGTANQYPRFEYNGVTVESGKPFVLSGKLYFKNSTTQYTMDIVNGSTRKEIFTLYKNGVINVNGVREEGTSWMPGDWIWFSAYITPGEQLENSTIRLVFGGNVSGETVLERTLNLSSIGTGTKKIYYNASLSKGNNDALYLDEAKIYYPTNVVADFETEPQIGDKSITVRFSHDIDYNSVTGIENVKITAVENGNVRTIVPESVTIDSAAPDSIVINMPEEIKNGVEYTLELLSLTDNGGNAVSGKVEFGTQASDYFNITNSSLSNLTDNSITINIEAEKQSLMSDKNIYIAVAMYNSDDTLAELKIVNGTIAAGDGIQTLSDTVQFNKDSSDKHFAMYVWENGETMYPLIEKAVY